MKYYSKPELDIMAREEIALEIDVLMEAMGKIEKEIDAYNVTIYNTKMDLFQLNLYIKDLEEDLEKKYDVIKSIEFQKVNQDIYDYSLLVQETKLNACLHKHKSLLDCLKYKTKQLETGNFPHHIKRIKAIVNSDYDKVVSEL